MNKYQYDEEYIIAEEAKLFFFFLDYEEEEAFSRQLRYGKYK